MTPGYRLRPYDPHRDYLRVRDMLSATYLASQAPRNWGIERWNWSRYHPSVFEGDVAANIRAWEGAVTLWEAPGGDLAGLVHVEDPRPGDAYLERHPAHPGILEEMVAHAERTLRAPDKGTLRIYVSDHDVALQGLLARRGYTGDAERPYYDSEYTIGTIPPPRLPEGFAVRSMADANDLPRRCRVQGLGFDHLDPAEWATPYAWSQVQTAPDYRADLDLYVVGPDGEFVSSCIAWIDAPNRIGFFEPVSTHMGYRRRGFGREVVLEGIRRLAALGATRARVGSGQPFYAAVGFGRIAVGRYWTSPRLP
jgi:hypothetical protein